MSLAQEITVCSSWWGFDLISGREWTGRGWGGRRKMRREEGDREGGGRWGGRKKMRREERDRDGGQRWGGRRETGMEGNREGGRKAALLFAHNRTLYLLSESLSLCPHFQLYCSIYMAWHTTLAHIESFKLNLLLVGLRRAHAEVRGLCGVSSLPPPLQRFQRPNPGCQAVL